MARKNQAEIVVTAKDRTKAAIQSVNKGLTRMATVGVAAAVAGTILLTRESLKLVDALAKTSQKLGIATEDLSALRLAAQKTGVTTRALDLGIQRATRRISEAAQGSGVAAKALDELGLEAKELVKLTPDQQFAALADAFAKVDNQADKVRLGFKLFDSEGVALINTLEGGREALNQAAAATRKYGTAISAVDAKVVEEANDAFTDLQESVKGLGFDLARRFAPGMIDANQGLANFVVTLRRDFIPAMALLFEQLGILENNVRGLSDIELAVRVEVKEDEIRELEQAIAAAEERAQKARRIAVKAGEEEYAEARASGVEAALLAEKEAEKTSAEARLEEIKAEQKRRADIILAEEQKLAEARRAQVLQADAELAEARRAEEQAAFEERLEAEAERNSAYIEGRIKLAQETARLNRRSAEEDRRRLVEQGRAEERAAANTVRLRRSTVQTSVSLLQVLAGKNKTVARALFLVEKGLAIARTVQNTAAASVKALAELGPVAGPPAAAAIQAYGAAQVGLIAATALTGVGAIGSGGGGGSLSLGGAGAGGAGFADQSVTVETGRGPGPVPEQGVVQLVFPNVFGITDEAIDALADALREASQNRDVIVVSNEGRNAELLAEGANG